MFRKLTIALGAIAAVSAASLAPALAKVPLTMPPPANIKMLQQPPKIGPSGWGHQGYGGSGFGGGFAIGIGLSPAYADDSDCYVVRKIVATPYGLRKRYVTVCE